MNVQILRRLKNKSTIIPSVLTRILLIAATISVRLVGRGTSRVPIYCNKEANKKFTIRSFLEYYYCPIIRLLKALLRIDKITEKCPTYATNSKRSSDEGE